MCSAIGLSRLSVVMGIEHLDVETQPCEAMPSNGSLADKQAKQASHEANGWAIGPEHKSTDAQ